MPSNSIIRFKSIYSMNANRSILMTIIILCLLISPQYILALSQAQITTEMGAGWNLGNQLEANSSGTPNEMAWDNPVITREHIPLVNSTGFKSIRIPVSYLNKIREGPNYTIDNQRIFRVKEVVD